MIREVGGGRGGGRWAGRLEVIREVVREVGGAWADRRLFGR